MHFARMHGIAKPPASFGMKRVRVCAEQRVGVHPDAAHSHSVRAIRACSMRRWCIGDAPKLDIARRKCPNHSVQTII